MKLKLLVLFSMLVPYYCMGQNPVINDPGYNRTVPRLIMMKHVESSNSAVSKRISLSDFDEKTSFKETNIFVIYKLNGEVGSKVMNTAELLMPPKRLMDFYLTYNYTYKVYLDEAASSDKMNFNIRLASGDKVVSLGLENHVLHNGKISSKRISSKALEVVYSDSAVTIKVNPANLVVGSYVTLKADISSVNFEEIGAFNIENAAYTETISFSMPEIFKYNLLAQNISFDLIFEEKRPFELLHFIRDKEGTIKEFNVNNYCYKWKIAPRGGNAGGYKFELAEISFPEKADIGIVPSDIINYSR